MNYLDIEKVKKLLKEGVAGYSSVSIASFLENIDSLLDIIDDLQKENEALKSNGVGQYAYKDKVSVPVYVKGKRTQKKMIIYN